MKKTILITSALNKDIEVEQVEAKTEEEFFEIVDEEFINSFSDWTVIPHTKRNIKKIEKLLQIMKS